VNIDQAFKTVDFSPSQYKDPKEIHKWISLEESLSPPYVIPAGNFLELQFLRSTNEYLELKEKKINELNKLARQLNVEGPADAQAGSHPLPSCRRRPRRTA